MRHLRTFVTCLLTTTYFIAAPLSAHAADKDVEIAALKAQLQALSARLEALEKATPKTAPVASAPVYAAPAPSSASAQAPSVQQRSTPSSPAVTTGATPTTTVAGEGQPVVGGSMPGSFKLPGTNTSIKFGGYAKLDAISDLNHAYGAQYANFSAIPLDGSASDQQDGQFNAHARQSRINLETRTPTAIGEMKTFFEVDFFGSARGNPNTTNGEGLQLRQAYGQIGNVLAGQTWSNFMDMDAYPESLDYIGPAGLTFIRQAQLRYTDTLSEHLGYSVALESPQTDFSVTSTDVNLSDMPDVTGKLTYKDSFGHLALRGMARKLNAGNTTTGAEDEDFGWGLGVSGKINTIGKDAIMFQGVYGDGIGRYLLDVAFSGNGNTYVNNELDSQEAWGGYAGYQHFWSDTWRSNFLAGYTAIDNDVSRTGTGVNKEIMSGHANLIWSPVPAYRVGVEYMHGYREVEDGREGDLDRLQASFMYLF